LFVFGYRENTSLALLIHTDIAKFMFFI